MTWPPQAWNYDVPVSYDVDVWDIFLSSVKMSIRSMGDTALYIVAIFIAFSVVLVILKRFTNSSGVEKGVFNRKLSRDIFETDVNRNSESIIEDKIRRKKIDLLANLRFHDRHKDLLVDDRVNRMEISHLAEQKYYGKENARKYYNSRKGKR